jgi:hypothetical protein
MLPSLPLYLAFLLCCSAVLLWHAFRADRVLGWTLVLALAANLTGAGLMDWWVRTMHNRQFTAADEVGYQFEGARILQSWRDGQSFVRSTIGVYAPINAVVIAAAGPGQTPMRMTTAVVGAAGVAVAFWLGLVLFGRLGTARLAAFLSATSPLLILYSWANLRDRWIGVIALFVILCGVRLIIRWTWPRLILLAGAIVALTELRHYWGALLGWLSIGVFGLFGASRWTMRAGQTAGLVLAVGLALWVATGSFLAITMQSETAVRYVSVTPSDTGEGGRRPAGAAAPAQPQPPDSGPTLGEARAAESPLQWRLMLKNLAFVLFGRVKARADGGQFASIFLLPEALWAPILFLMSALGLFLCLRAGQWSVLLPAAYIGVIMAVLTWLHGDEWNTYRFRGLYWPVLLVLAAGGLMELYDRVRARSAPGAPAVAA